MIDALLMSVNEQQGPFGQVLTFVDRGLGSAELLKLCKQ